MVSGTHLILIGLIVIGVGTALTMWGQSINSGEDIRRLSEQNEISKKAIEAQASQIESLKAQSSILENIGRSQLAATFYTEELNQPIRSLYIKLNLKEELKVEDFIPFKIAVDLNPLGEEKLKILRLVRYASHDQPTWGYTVSEISKDEQSVTHSYTRIHKATSVKLLLIQIYATQDIELHKVKDFHDELFMLHLSENLTKIVESAELIVNGWSIMQSKFNGVTWREESIPRWKKLDQESLVIKKPWLESKDFKIGLWRLDLYSSIPTKYPLLSTGALPSSITQKMTLYVE